MRSPKPSPFGYDVSGLAHEAASLRRATRSEARARGGGDPTPLAGSCCSLDAARRSSNFAGGNAAAAFRTWSVSSVFKGPQHHGVLTRSPPPFVPTPEGASRWKFRRTASGPCPAGSCDGTAETSPNATRKAPVGAASYLEASCAGHRLPSCASTSSCSDPPSWGSGASSPAPPGAILPCPEGRGLSPLLCPSTETLPAPGPRAVRIVGVRHSRQTKSSLHVLAAPSIVQFLALAIRRRPRVGPLVKAPSPPPPQPATMRSAKPARWRLQSSATSCRRQPRSIPGWPGRLQT